MLYQVFDQQTDKLLFETPFYGAAMDFIERDYEGNAYYNQVPTCRGCEEAGAPERYDAHGITTGHWCDTCYDSSKYPYRKDSYPTIETHGYGERLSEDY